MEKVLIVNAGTGNLSSVQNTLKKIGVTAHISASPDDILQAHRIILPGVGAFGEFMNGLTSKNLIGPIHKFITSGKPILGICVGMQALFDFSEEMGKHPGLSLISGKVTRFPEEIYLKVPHTGWNQINFDRFHPLFQGISPKAYVYFNHTYYCAPQKQTVVAATTNYGFDFCSAVHNQNIYGVQFHPEKSQVVGKLILKNFLTVSALKTEGL